MNVLENSQFRVNGLVINSEKTTSMSFDTQQIDTQQNKSFLRPKIIFANMEIKYKYETKFLGLHLTEILKQDINTNNLSSKLSEGFYVILSLKGIEFKHLNNYMLCTFSLTFDVPTSLKGGMGWLSDREGKQNFNCKRGR